MTIEYREFDVPSQTGRTAFVTGANTGIGYEASRVLATRGARVLLGCRSADKAQQAIAKIRNETPDADVSWIPLDLGDLSSVSAAADQVLAEPRLDLLINNAGVMVPPRTETTDGFELQFGVNHLGHFALTGHLVGKLASQAGARVVTVSSSAHRGGKIHYDDLSAEKSYARLARYQMSKFANILFMYQLQKLFEENDTHCISVACHPGASGTDLGRHIAPWLAVLLWPMQFVMNSPAEGALPTLMAATHAEVLGGDYFGPTRWGEMAHSAEKVKTDPPSQDLQNALKLWQLSEQLTGVNYQF
jgi:NAD(P)-dependent dehydrogenase (short-subunit alcohol dehydrogenase family)